MAARSGRGARASGLGREGSGAVRVRDLAGGSRPSKAGGGAARGEHRREQRRGRPQPDADSSEGESREAGVVAGEQDDGGVEDAGGRGEIGVSDTPMKAVLDQAAHAAGEGEQRGATEDCDGQGTRPQAGGR